MTLFVLVECDRLGPIQSRLFILQIIPSTLRNDKTYVTGYIVTLYFVVMNFVPFTLLAILNTAIYKQVTSRFSLVEPQQEKTRRFNMQNTGRGHSNRTCKQTIDNLSDGRPPISRMQMAVNLHISTFSTTT